MDEKLLDPQTDMIIIDIQSILHCINYCETGNFDDA